MTAFGNSIMDTFGNAAQKVAKSNETKKSVLWLTLEVWGKTQDKPDELVRMATLMSLPLDDVNTLNPKDFFGNRAQQEYRMNLLLQLRENTLKMPEGTSFVLNGDDGNHVNGFNIVVTRNATAKETTFTDNPIGDLLGGFASKFA